MKAFKDLKVGDNIYVYYWDNNKFFKLKITDIVIEYNCTKFYYGKYSSDYVRILPQELKVSSTSSIYADITKLLSDMNKNI